MNFTIDKNIGKMSGIYSITTSIDNRFYIGSTINFWRRYMDHKTRLKNGIHNNKYIQAFSDKYGIDKFSFNLLYLCKNTCLIYNEKLWIEVLKPQFNIKPIVQRPYFEDEIKYDLNKKIARIQLVYLNLGIGLDDREIIKKHKHLPDLTISEELNYYAGNPPSCRFPRRVKKLKRIRKRRLSKEESNRLSKVIIECRMEYRNINK